MVTERGAKAIQPSRQTAHQDERTPSGDHMSPQGVCCCCRESIRTDRPVQFRANTGSAPTSRVPGRSLRRWLTFFRVLGAPGGVPGQSRSQSRDHPVARRQQMPQHRQRRDANRPGRTGERCQDAGERLRADGILLSIGGRDHRVGTEAASGRIVGDPLARYPGDPRFAIPSANQPHGPGAETAPSVENNRKLRR